MSQELLASLLNANVCREILNKFNQETNNNFQYKTFTIVSATDAKGFLGEYFRLTIQCIQQNNKTGLNIHDREDDSMMLKFFIKNLPPVNEQHEKVMIFRKECSLYDSLLPKLQDYSSERWCPKIYMCHSNFLILEDLNSQGFYSLASQDILKLDEMFAVLNGLSAMHASSLLYEFDTKENIEDVYSESLKEITVHPDIAWFTTGINAILQIATKLSNYQTEVARKFVISELPMQLKNVYFMVNPSPKYRNVLCHRDTWGGNVFLHHNNSLKPAVFVDFQTCRYCPVAIDVIFTLFMNLTKQERLEKQSLYIKFYYQQLLQHIENNISSTASLNEVIFSEAEFLESIDEFMLFGFVYRALAITILKVPSEFVTDYYKNEERSETLLQYMKGNEEFCQIMNESIEDIIEAVADVSIKQNVVAILPQTVPVPKYWAIESDFERKVFFFVHKIF